MRYVIIGNSAAAVGAVEAIRKADASGEIVVISDEPHQTYSRPLITYLLGGKIGQERMRYRPEGFYEQHGILPKLGQKAVSIDPGAKLIRLEDGQTLEYDRLLIATGGAPFVPPINGVDRPGVFTFTRWADADAVMRMIGRVRHAVVIGAGLIGLKVVEGLYWRNVSCTVVELASRVLVTALDETASQLMEEHLSELGIGVRTNNTVEEIQGAHDGVAGVRLKSGEDIECQLVIVAIGVRPNTDLALTAGCAVNRGILVNERMETSVEGIYAAGDCVEAEDMLLGEARPIPIWPLAYRQGAVAGANMAGGGARYSQGFVMNSIEVCGLPTISCGLYDPPDTNGFAILSKLDVQRRAYRKVVLRDNRVVGACLVNDIDHAGVLTGLIRDQIDVGAFKDQLLDENFSVAYLPAEWRAEKLAKGV